MSEVRSSSLSKCRIISELLTPVSKHEKRCKLANLVRGQSFPKNWTFWIKTMIIKDVEKISRI